MNILIINPDLGEGGIHRFYSENSRFPETNAVVETINASPFTLAETGLGSTCYEYPDRSEFFPRPIGSYADLIAMLQQLARMLSTAFAAWQKAKEREPDIIEVCDWPLGFVPAVLEQSVPYVVQCHGSVGQIAQHDPQFGQELEAVLVQLIEPQLMSVAHRVQSYSKENASFWEAMTKRQVLTIRPAFALDDCGSQSGEVAATAAAFGRLQRWKGPHILCEALRKLDTKAPIVDWYGGVKPWASGDWPADKRIATDYPNIWARNLRHHPAVPRETVTKLQARALFNVVPSTWDVFNFTAIESMAACRPTIVSKGAGASELIVDGENGFVFENESSEGLADAIERVLTMPEGRRRQIGCAGWETIRVELAPERIAEQRISAYEEAIRSFREEPPPNPNPWLADLLKPRMDGRLDASLLLELVPMRLIAGHMKDRLFRKLGWKRRWL